MILPLHAVTDDDTYQPPKCGTCYFATFTEDLPQGFCWHSPMHVDIERDGYCGQHSVLETIGGPEVLVRSHG